MWNSPRAGEAGEAKGGKGRQREARGRGFTSGALNLGLGLVPPLSISLIAPKVTPEVVTARPEPPAGCCAIFLYFQQSAMG